jgi:arginyl-tRNA synthetase
MKDALRTLIVSALEKACADGVLSLESIPEPHLEVPRDTTHGDLASNIAMSLAKPAKMAPRAIAEAICERLSDDAGLLRAVEVAGPGFINFSFSDAAWRSRLIEILDAGDDFGSCDIGKGKRVQVEFVSANPTGPLHIGHGRGAVVGDALARVLAAAGYDVDREYYVNDAGRQMEMLGRSILARYLEQCGREVVFPEEGYPGDYVHDVARALRERDGDRWASEPEEDAVAAASAFGGEVLLDRIRDDLAEFGIEFDCFTSEKALRDAGTVAASTEDLKGTQYLYEKDGALWFRSTGFGDDKDRAVVKSNGDLTYFASDIAYHRGKFERGYDEVVDVWGADHHGYVKRVAAALEALEIDSKRFRVLLVQIVNLTRDGEPVRMGKRSGEFVELRQVLDEVGPDLARFFFLMRRADAQLEFDLELARRQTAENPVFYVQYAHTRIAGIFRQAESKGVALPAHSVSVAEALGNEDEIGLIRTLAEFPTMVEGAAASYEPHRVVFYAQKLAGDFHRFYTRHKCVTDDEALTAGRLLLVEAVKQVIGRALRLVGVSAPDRM